MKVDQQEKHQRCRNVNSPRIQRIEYTHSHFYFETAPKQRTVTFTSFHCLTVSRIYLLNQIRERARERKRQRTNTWSRNVCSVVAEHIKFVPTTINTRAKTTITTTSTSTMATTVKNYAGNTNKIHNESGQHTQQQIRNKTMTRELFLICIEVDVCVPISNIEKITT